MTTANAAPSKRSTSTVSIVVTPAYSGDLLMPRLSPVRALIVAVLALAGAGVEQPAVASPPAAARLPSTFVGVNGNDPLFGPPVDLAHEFHLMVAAGVESFRTAFDWSAAQPYKSESQVPADERSQFQLVGGVPTRFSAIDPIVTLSATLRMTLLPRSEEHTSEL